MPLLLQNMQQQKMHNHFNHRVGNRYKSNSRSGRNNNRKAETIPNIKTGRSRKRSLSNRIGHLNSKHSLSRVGHLNSHRQSFNHKNPVCARC